MPAQQDFAVAYDKAPQYVKDFIAGDELSSAFETIREKYKLHLDDAGVLADLLNAVILDLTPLGGFEAAVAEHIPNLNQEMRTTLTRDVNEKIFAVLRSRANPETSAVPMITGKLTTPMHEVPKEFAVPMPEPEVPHPYHAGDPYHEPIE